jgi:hypothetical protein
VTRPAPDDGLGFARGCCWTVPAGVLVWGLVVRWLLT